MMRVLPEHGCVVLRGIGHCPLQTDSDIGLVTESTVTDAAGGLRRPPGPKARP